MAKIQDLRRKPRKIISLLLGICTACLASVPVQANQKIFFTYDPINISLRVDSLELFATQGKINKNLAFYLQFATPEWSFPVFLIPPLEKISSPVWEEALRFKGAEMANMPCEPLLFKPLPILTGFLY